MERRKLPRGESVAATGLQAKKDGHSDRKGGDLWIFCLDGDLSCLRLAGRGMIGGEKSRIWRAL